MLRMASVKRGRALNHVFWGVKAGTARLPWPRATYAGKGALPGLGNSLRHAPTARWLGAQCTQASAGAAERAPLRPHMAERTE